MRKAINDQTMKGFWYMLNTVGKYKYFKQGGDSDQNCISKRSSLQAEVQKQIRDVKTRAETEKTGGSCISLVGDDSGKQRNIRGFKCFKKKKSVKLFISLFPFYFVILT